MFSEKHSDTTLSLALSLSAGAWGLYWFPLRTIENVGISGSWGVVFFNACPLLVLLPWLVLNLKKLIGVLGPTLLAALMIGMAFTLYANGLVETTVVRATLLYWFCQVGQCWQNGCVLIASFLFSRRTSPAATFQMIDFSAADSSLHEVNVDPHERGYEPDCEQPKIVVPVQVI